MSTTDVSDLRDTIVPKSDQLNADQLLAGPITITVTGVRRGSGDDQPLIISYRGDGGRPYKPCKSMRRVLVFAWGTDGADWIGRSMTLFNRPDVKFGGQEVGGIRISHLSHIERDIEIPLTVTRGKKEPARIRRLTVVDEVAEAKARLQAAARAGMASLQAVWGALPKEQRKAIGPNGCPDEFKLIAQQQNAEQERPPASDFDGELGK